MARELQVGDAVTVRAYYCEMNGMEGKVISVSGDPDDTLPYMVQLCNFREWPFSGEELELHDLDD